ncbi:MULTISPECIES: helix-turn-helix domain-containing protein [unclassified Nitrobacter]|uniref:helix-turn-helix domain-containing protein n=1 Tax=unclassified Nitrobacter TaxID=2620411 RepID=UPI0005926565|nr:MULTISPECIES: helix-turn-helix transcriptional regulator [unclassified Nitrobacter]MCB1394120.1 helix-turn-helix transcriptional regulator [Nitrobacter sp.]MCV0387371.1 helix-turn-helix domain-containing protein [Nitrobacter sp.]
MPYATDDILQTLRAAREQTGLSQRDLSARIGVPQSHISKIESGGTDLRLSSLVELARALDYELVLVPRKLLPAVEAIVGGASMTLSGETRQRATVLNRAQAAVARLTRTHPDAAEFKRLDQTLRELANFQFGKADLATLRAVTDKLLKLPTGAAALPAAERASRQLRELRNRIAHALPEAPRPAYELDEEDDDA